MGRAFRRTVGPEDSISQTALTEAALGVRQSVGHKQDALAASLFRPVRRADSTGEVKPVSQIVHEACEDSRHASQPLNCLNEGRQVRVVRQAIATAERIFYVLGPLVVEIVPVCQSRYRAAHELPDSRTR